VGVTLPTEENFWGLLSLPDLWKNAGFEGQQTRVLKILALRQCDAEKAGVDRKTFQRIKERIRGGEINIKTGAIKRLLTIC